MLRQPGRTAVAAIAVVALLCGAVAPVARANAAASLAGRVFEPDGHTPRPGASVSLLDAGGQRSAQSAATTAEGAFNVEGVAPGEYRLLIEADEGAYLTASSVTLSAGANPPLALSLAPALAQSTSSDPSANQETLPRWAQWLIAGGIGVAALLVIVETNDDDDPASAF